MTNEKMDLVNKLKEKMAEVNNVISEINKDKDNRLVVKFYQQEWEPQINSIAVKNAVKYLSCSVTETFNY